MTGPDSELLRRFSHDRAEDAFQQLVERHVDLVYSTALRALCGDRALAEDVTQSVFADLAARAPGLDPNIVLAGWLHRATRFAAAKAVRAEQRRRTRETVAAEIQAMNTDPEPDWPRLGPLLDEALETLPVEDRDAVLLRFFERRPLSAVGATIGLSEEAARKRIHRALDRLRQHLARRGLHTTGSALGAVISTHAVHAAPAGLVANLASASLTATPIALSSLKLLPALAMTKCQTLAAAVTLAAGLATPLIWQHRQISVLKHENSDLRARLEQVAAEAAHRPDTAVATPPPEPKLGAAEHTELLRLRGEVARLRREPPTPGGSPDTGRAGVGRPSSTLSSQPGYIPADHYEFAGLATPAAALQSYYWALENPASGKLLEVLSLPRSLQELTTGTTADLTVSGETAGLTQGIAAPTTSEMVAQPFSQDGERLRLSNGYRAVSENELPDGRRSIGVERELPDGSVVSETVTLVPQEGTWKVQPGAGLQVEVLQSDGNLAVFKGGPGEANRGAVHGVKVEVEANLPAPPP